MACLDLDSNLLILIIVIAAVVIVCLFLVLYFTVFRNAALKRQVLELSKKFEKSHGLLLGQDYNYVKRLETIASLNLTYVQEYTLWNKRFVDIRDVADATAQSSINTLKDLLSDRRFHELKQVLPKSKAAIDTYEAQVVALDDNLKKKFQDEEDCKQLAFDEKEALRKAKQDYYNKQPDLSIVTGTFDTIFQKLDGLFSAADQSIDNAQYLDAKTIITNQISPVTKQVAKVLQILPAICTQIQSVLPDKLSSLSAHYEELTHDGYPLNQILLPSDISEMENELSALSKRVSGLNLAGVSEALDAMSKKIDDYNFRFDKEKEARAIFEKEVDEAYKKENGVELDFVSLCHSLPKVREIYAIGAVQQANIDEISKTVNQAGASKRSLDTYIHSGTRQPYTLLVEKMHLLRDQAEQAQKLIDSFKAYLGSLKTDSEAAYKALPLFYSRLKRAEKSIRDINLEAVSAKFNPRVDECFAIIGNLDKDLQHMPIDVEKVDKDIHELSEKGDSLFADLDTAQADLTSAENAIVFANRFRGSGADVNNLVSQSEGLFYAGDFVKSYEGACAAVEHLREGN
jgi:septation ring formation regulator